MDINSTSSAAASWALRYPVVVVVVVELLGLVVVDGVVLVVAAMMVVADLQEFRFLERENCDVALVLDTILDDFAAAAAAVGSSVNDDDGNVVVNAVNASAEDEATEL